MTNKGICHKTFIFFNVKARFFQEKALLFVVYWTDGVFLRRIIECEIKK